MYFQDFRKICWVKTHLKYISGPKFRALSNAAGLVLQKWIVLALCRKFTCFSSKYVTFHQNYHAIGPLWRVGPKKNMMCRQLKNSHPTKFGLDLSNGGTFVKFAPRELVQNIDFKFFVKMYYFRQILLFIPVLYFHHWEAYACSQRRFSSYCVSTSVWQHW